jgi:hypothetical protein
MAKPKISKEFRTAENRMLNDCSRVVVAADRRQAVGLRLSFEVRHWSFLMPLTAASQPTAITATPIPATTSANP